MRFIKHIIGAVLTTALIGVPLTLTQIVYADISDISVYVNGIKTEFDHRRQAKTTVHWYL